MRLQNLSLAFVVNSGFAHYIFSRLIVNNTISPDFKYVRDVATPRSGDEKIHKFDPQYDIYSTNITCGRLAFSSAKSTATADVVAGDEVGFRISQSYVGSVEEIFHAGPAQAYLARAPNDMLSTFSGLDGDWVKIAFIGAFNDTNWITYYATSVNFTIPRNTPSGRYLLRFEQFWPTPEFNTTQWYVSCAQINIKGTENGTFRGYDFAKFPGTYDIMDPGLWTPENIGDMTKLLSYVPPGPAVWKG